jgi:1,4-alpha-glucan branching enzyme
MKLFIHRIILSLCVFMPFVLSSQAVVTLNPPFPTGNSPVTLTFDASLGNAGLVDLPAGQIVYAHMGITINNSNWQYVVGNWGTVDARVAMTRVGTSNIYTLEIQPSIREWFSENSNNNATVPAAAVISKLCLVFRNSTGALTGKTSSGSDIFIDLPTTSFSAAITSHDQQSLLLPAGQTVNFVGQTSANAIMEFTLDGASVLSDAGTTILNYPLNTNDLSDGIHTLEFIANNGAQIIRDTVLLTRHSAVTVSAIPAYGFEGIIYPNDTTAYLQLRAPGKEFIYVLGDFNNWNFDPAYSMKRTPDGQFYWIELSGLTPGNEYRFQYHIGWEGLRVTDPYVQKILDPWNDQYISNTTFPDLIPYPTGKAEGVVGILNTTEEDYQWDNSYSYTKPAKEDLVVYELLVRDFSTERSFQEVLDRLPYLDALGVNAIQFMPLAEFEGNDSWGYNPSFFMALDKAYGTKNKLKELIDSCHRRGMAVILDVVFNHSFGQNPMVQMYFNPEAGEFGETSAENPWFNSVARHPFNVGYDFNHESQATRYFVKKVGQHWLQDYKFDGFRFDLSKGFTQTNSGSNVGLWGNFDQSRIDIIYDYVNHYRSIADDPYMILEHFGAWNEELAYANGGIMMWAKGTSVYNEATMGFLNGNNQNLYSNTPQARGWSNYALMQYMESHDEERLMYKNINFGNQVDGYSTRSLATALDRMSLAACFFIPLPGPKMIWQFGELGYDFSINRCSNGSISEDCRTSAKPVVWQYYDNTNRRGVFDTYRKLNYLKTTYPVFRDLNVGMELGPYRKWIRYDSNDLDVMVVGNFDVAGGDINVNFTQTGKWYDYLEDDSINISNTNTTLNLAAGEYHVYLSQRVTPPTNTYGGVPNSIDNLEDEAQILVFPNPFNDQLTIILPLGAKKAEVEIFDIAGRSVWSKQVSGDEIVQMRNNELPNGLYFCRIQQSGKVFSTKIIKQ